MSDEDNEYHDDDSDDDDSYDEEIEFLKETVGENILEESEESDDGFGFDSSDSMLDYFIERYIEQVDTWTLELTVPSYLSRDNKPHVSAYSVGDGEAREV